MGLGGVGAVFSARNLICGRVNRARKFMPPHARVMFLESKLAKTHITQIWINTARCKLAGRAIGFGKGRGPTWPFRTHRVDGGI
jgi:hypothetical protein